MANRRRRLAIIVSHPVQYYVPLYKLLNKREDIDLHVFFTWHCGSAPVLDPGFGKYVKWDIPLTDGFSHSLVPNTSRRPGTDRFFGLINQSLFNEVVAWRPDVVYVTGWAWWSHLVAIVRLANRGTSVLFRGDSHLMDKPQRGLPWLLKYQLLKWIYKHPALFLYTGQANKRYYEAFGVGDSRLVYCPHSIDVNHFSVNSAQLEAKAADWRRNLRIPKSARVALFAGKFEPKKRPIELMRAFLNAAIPDTYLILVGSGELEQEIVKLAENHEDVFRILPFQNQSLMPVVYRLGDLFVLPSGYGETWGLAVNEALACGRPVLASDRVGCAEDVVTASCGRVFNHHELLQLELQLKDLLTNPCELSYLKDHAVGQARLFDISITEQALYDSVWGTGE